MLKYEKLDLLLSRLELLKKKLYFLSGYSGSRYEKTINKYFDVSTDTSTAGMLEGDSAKLTLDNIEDEAFSFSKFKNSDNELVDSVEGVIGYHKRKGSRYFPIFSQNSTSAALQTIATPNTFYPLIYTTLPLITLKTDTSIIYQYPYLRFEMGFTFNSDTTRDMLNLRMYLQKAEANGEVSSKLLLTDNYTGISETTKMNISGNVRSLWLGGEIYLNQVISPDFTTEATSFETHQGVNINSPSDYHLLSDRTSLYDTTAEPLTNFLKDKDAYSVSLYPYTSIPYNTGDVRYLYEPMYKYSSSNLFLKIEGSIRTTGATGTASLFFAHGMLSDKPYYSNTIGLKKGFVLFKRLSA